eukprot:428604-Hanusia_phi.AAC.1
MMKGDMMKGDMMKGDMMQGDMMKGMKEVHWRDICRKVKEDAGRNITGGNERVQSRKDSRGERSKEDRRKVEGKNEGSLRVDLSVQMQMLDESTG